MKRHFFLIALLVEMLSVGCSQSNPLEKAKCAPNEILYLTEYGYPLKDFPTDGFGGNFVSHTYEKGIGRIAFDFDVTQIPQCAFLDCQSLSHIKLPANVKSIGESAFKDCKSLVYIPIPEGVTSIGEGAFAGCMCLEGFEGALASEDKRCLIFDGVLVAFAPNGLTTYSIPDGVKEIGNEVFSGCDLLESITIPTSVTSIDSGAFRDCSGLTSIDIPDSVAEIGGGAFGGCSGLMSVVIPDGVTSIGSYAFYSCSSLTKVTIPSSVTLIGGGAFEGCTSLATVYCNSTIPPKVELVDLRDGYEMWMAFENNAPGLRINVPKSSVQMYRMSEGWYEYAGFFVGDGSMKSQVSQLYPTEVFLVPNISDAEYRSIADNEESIDSPIFDHFYSSSCSWYCGGSVDKITASSHLSPQGRFSYKPEHAHDFDWESAWVEGVNGDGIGQYLLYEFPSGPRVTTVNILNGYVKTAKAWKENSRVKKLKVYYNNTPIAILNLEDSRSLQSFDIGVVGRLEGKSWTLKFEILEVYKGTKYRDTAISEIYFDGIDVH